MDNDQPCRTRWENESAWTVERDHVHSTSSIGLPNRSDTKEKYLGSSDDSQRNQCQTPRSNQEKGEEPKWSQVSGSSTARLAFDTVGRKSAFSALRDIAQLSGLGINESRDSLRRNVLNAASKNNRRILLQVFISLVISCLLQVAGSGELDHSSH